MEDVERTAADRRRPTGQFERALVQCDRVEIGRVVLSGALSGAIGGKKILSTLLGQLANEHFEAKRVVQFQLQYAPHRERLLLGDHRFMDRFRSFFFQIQLYTA